MQAVDFRFNFTPVVRGFCFSPDTLSMYYSFDSNNDIKEIKLLMLSVKTGEYSIHNRIKIKRNSQEHYISSVNKYNKLYFLYYTTDPDKFLIRTFRGNPTMNEQMFESKIPQLEKHIYQCGLRYSRSPFDYKTSLGSGQGKFYLDSAAVVILFDGFKPDRNGTDRTEIEILGLESGQSLSREIRDLINCNSYFYDDLLFRTAYNRDTFEFQIYVLHPLQLRKKFVYTATQPFRFISSPFYESGYTNFYTREEKSISSTRELLDEIRRGNPVIAVKQNRSDTYNVLLGSYEMTFAPEGYIMDFMLDNTTSSGTNTQNESVSKYFEVSLSADSLNIIAYQEDLTSAIEDFIKKQAEMNKNRLLYRVFYHPLGNHIVYFDSKLKRIRILRSG